MSLSFLSFLSFGSQLFMAIELGDAVCGGDNVKLDVGEQARCMTTKLTAAVLGGSGSVGKHVVKTLAQSPNCDKVLVFTRRELGDLQKFFSLADASETSKLQQKVVPMDEASLAGVDGVLAENKVNAVFVTLGVGAPSGLPKGDEGKNELMRVDCLLPTSFLTAAKKANVQHASLLTAVGADINEQYSSFRHTGAGGPWYNHVKGTVEKNTKDLKFQSTAIFEPATLLGADATPGVLNWLAPKLDWVLPAKYNSIHISVLAGKMIRQTFSAIESNSSACTTFEGKSLQAL